MDASPSASGNGFDAALKALEDLETSVVQTRDETPAAVSAPAPTIEPISAIGFSDVDEPTDPVAIVAIPAAEIVDLPAEPAPVVTVPEPEVAAVVPVAAPAMAVAPGPAPIPAAMLAPAALAPASAPASGKFTKIAIGLGLLSSTVSAAGLVVAERTIKSAELVVADARERARQAEQANKLIRDLETVRDKQVELLQAQQAQLAAAPVSSAELQHRMEALQAGLLARDPMNNVVSAIRESQAGNNARFSEFGLKIDRLEAAVNGRH